MNAPRETLMSPTEFLAKLAGLKPGQWFVYYIGFMPKDLGGWKRRLQETAALCEEFHLCLLTQKKTGFQLYEYRATKSTAEFKLNYQFSQRFDKLK